MSVRLHPLQSPEVDTLLPILKDADEGVERIRAVLHDDANVSYAAYDGARLVGAVTVRWKKHESEIIYIAVSSELRRRGYGKAIIMTLLYDEARKRGVHSLLVGTANSSLENISFYQKCGFRMDHVRKDFFAYIQPPISENGILMRDMLVLKYTFEKEQG